MPNTQPTTVHHISPLDAYARTDAQVGYSGHVPGSRDIDFVPPLGGVPLFSPEKTIQELGQRGRKSRDIEWFNGDDCTDDDLRPFRDVSGVASAGHG